MAKRVKRKAPSRKSAGGNPPGGASPLTIPAGTLRPGMVVKITAQGTQTDGSCESPAQGAQTAGRYAPDAERVRTTVRMRVDVKAELARRAKARGMSEAALLEKILCSELDLPAEGRAWAARLDERKAADLVRK